MIGSLKASMGCWLGGGSSHGNRPRRGGSGIKRSEAAVLLFYSINSHKKQSCSQQSISFSDRVLLCSTGSLSKRLQPCLAVFAPLCRVFPRGRSYAKAPPRDCLSHLRLLTKGLTACLWAPTVSQPPSLRPSI
jgi:hypothetical protein